MLETEKEGLSVHFWYFIAQSFILEVSNISIVMTTKIFRLKQ